MRWGCKQGKTLSAKQSFGKKVLKTHARNHAIKLYVRGCENDTTGSVILRHLAVVGRDVKRRSLSAVYMTLNYAEKYNAYQHIVICEIGVYTYANRYSVNLTVVDKT